MAIVRSDYWTESAVLGLPTGEDDNFERKSGNLLNEPDWRAKIGKQLSAFANSGGGHLFIGINNSGAIDGVPTHRAGTRTTTREWVEQIIPMLTDYPLRSFCVQEVIANTPSTIPVGHSVIAIDVHESDLAPHQNKADQIYYSRQSGTSRPSAHVFVDLLRHRPSAAILTSELVQVILRSATIEGPTVKAFLILIFKVTNTSRTVSAGDWRLVVEKFEGQPPGRERDCALVGGKPTEGDVIIHPGTMRLHSFWIQLVIHGHGSDVQKEVAELFGPNVSVLHRAASDTWAGNVVSTAILPQINVTYLSQRIWDMADGREPAEAIPFPT